MQRIRKYTEIGIRETSTTGTGTSSWQDDYSYFASLNAPFVLRGALLLDNSHAGRFYFHRDSGNSNCHGGFRPVIVPVS